MNIIIQSLHTVSILAGEYDLTVVVERGLGHSVKIHGHGAALAIQRLHYAAAALTAVNLTPQQYYTLTATVHIT